MGRQATATPEDVARLRTLAEALKTAPAAVETPAGDPPATQPDPTATPSATPSANVADAPEPKAGTEEDGAGEGETSAESEGAANASDLSAQIDGDTMVIYRNGEVEEVVALADLLTAADAEGVEMEVDGARVLKGMTTEGSEVSQEYAVWVRKAATLDKGDQIKRAATYKISIKKGGNLNPPKGMPTDPAKYADPTNFRYPLHDKTHVDNAASRWGDESNRSQYSTAEQKVISDRIAAAKKKFGESDSGKKASKGMSLDGLITDKKSLRYVVTDLVQKGMEPGDPLTDAAIEWATTNKMLAHLPADFGGSDLDWNTDAPSEETSGQSVHKDMGLDDLDDDDSALILSTAYDWPDSWITALQSLFNSFVTLVTAADNLQDAQDAPGLGQSWDALWAQLTAAAAAIYAASGEETDDEGAVVAKTFNVNAARHAAHHAVRAAVWTHKAGKRHSRGDVALIGDLHDNAIDQHAAAIELEPGVCGTDCPMNGGSADGATATKGMRLSGTEADDQPVAPGSNAEVERLQALLRDRDAEVEGLQAKTMALEQAAHGTGQERDALSARLEGMRRARNRAAGKTAAADPLSDAEQSKHKSMKPGRGDAGSVYDFGRDEDDHHVYDWRYQ